MLVVWHPDMDMRWCGIRTTARLVYKALVLYCTTRRRSDVRHDEDENFGDNYLFIIFNRDLVRDDQDEVYIYAT